MSSNGNREVISVSLWKCNQSINSATVPVYLKITTVKKIVLFSSKKPTVVVQNLKVCQKSAMGCGVCVHCVCVWLCCQLYKFDFLQVLWTLACAQHVWMRGWWLKVVVWPLLSTTSQQVHVICYFMWSHLIVRVLLVIEEHSTAFVWNKYLWSHPKAILLSKNVING